MEIVPVVPPSDVAVQPKKGEEDSDPQNEIIENDTQKRNQILAALPGWAQYMPNIEGLHSTPRMYKV